MRCHSVRLGRRLGALMHASVTRMRQLHDGTTCAPSALRGLAQVTVLRIRPKWPPGWRPALPGGADAGESSAAEARARASYAELVERCWAHKPQRRCAPRPCAPRTACPARVHQWTAWCCALPRTRRPAACSLPTCPHACLSPSPRMNPFNQPRQRMIRSLPSDSPDFGAIVSELQRLLQQMTDSDAPPVNGGAAAGSRSAAAGVVAPAPPGAVPQPVAAAAAAALALADDASSRTDSTLVRLQHVRAAQRANAVLTCAQLPGGGAVGAAVPAGTPPPQGMRQCPTDAPRAAASEPNGSPMTGATAVPTKPAAQLVSPCADGRASGSPQHG